MVDVDLNKIRILAESAERRAGELHTKADSAKPSGPCTCHPGREFTCSYHFVMNDFFYWSGKATSYRGIIAMAEMNAIVERELEEEGSCP